MKKLLYDGENITIYLKRDMYVGQEIDVAEELIVEGFVGVKTFASHLAEPKKFYNDFLARVVGYLDDVYKSIDKEGTSSI